MKILLNNNDLNEALYGVSNLGFVPTMGGLHKGHISLIKKSLKQCKKTIVSIFVNPTQFNNKKDFLNYPRNNNLDLSILKKLGVHFVFIPNKKDIYNFKRKNKIKLMEKNKILCAKFRKGHFEGVIDIMDRLTRLIKPKKIFMGEKDYQQYLLVKKFLEEKYRVKIIKCNTVRLANNVALSSRNIFLNKRDLLIAGEIINELINFKKILKKLKTVKNLLQYKKKDLVKKYKIKIEYLEIRNIKDLKKSNKIKNSKIFIAYYLNNTRLIDNL